jgi:transposase-like protein
VSDEGHLRCPYCNAYEVERLYLASNRVDSCTCRSCGERWDQEQATGALLDAAPRSPMMVRD